MTKSYSTKRSLITSVIALMLCFSMLLGTTFAWFTDSVTSANNKIVAGNLKVDLELLDKDTNNWNSIKENKDPIFNYSLWEPGFTDVKILKVENEGSLHLKWKANFILGDDENGNEQSLSALANVIDVYVCPSDIELTYPADRDLTGYTKVGTVAEFVNTIKDTTNGTLAPNGVAYLGIALKMQEAATNEYQDMTIAPFDIVISATQLNAEDDSFGSDYDENLTLPDVNTVTVPTGATTSSKLKLDKVTVHIPTLAGEGNYELQVVNKGTNTDENDKTTVSYDISVLKDGTKATGVEYPVEINVGKYLDIVSLKHNGNDITDYDYDITTGIVSFVTSSFSPFAIEYTPSTGIFDENPALYIKSLTENDSKYISTEIKVGGVSKWNVSERATTVFVEPTQSGKLYSIISGLQNNEHSTVYLKPGTYNEATTITVSSSMDIIGLGDAKDIRVIKKGSNTTKDKPSNQHLFNCTNNKSESQYIQVTIRNMYLESIEKNGYKNKLGMNLKADNAAVQSIRKSKVKCYDLIVAKDTGDQSSCAFYVNATNKLDDNSIVPAYMYAENCTLNIANNSKCVVSTSGTYKFYHNNLTYNGTAYTNNSGSILNQSMAVDDWDW